jgi:hypothetical protein
MAGHMMGLSHRKKWLILAGYSLLLLGLLASWNWLLDPYGVFRVNQQSIDRSPKQSKIDYLNANPGRFDTFVLGGSRAGVLEPSDLQSYMPGSSVYNLFYFLSDEYSNLKTVEYLVRTQSVKRILLQISFDELNRFNQAHTDLVAGLHPDVSGEHRWLFYANRLFAVEPLRKRLDRYEKAFNDWLKPSENLLAETLSIDLATGVLTHRPLRAHVFPMNTFPFGRIALDDTERSLAAIREIGAICANHQIELIVWLAPERFDKMRAYDPLKAAYFKKELRKITAYRDFAIASSITIEPKHYYDPFGHYKPEIGRMITHELFSGTSKFSIWVPKTNES